MSEQKPAKGVYSPEVERELDGYVPMDSKPAPHGTAPSLSEKRYTQVELQESLNIVVERTLQNVREGRIEGVGPVPPPLSASAQTDLIERLQTQADSCREIDGSGYLYRQAATALAASLVREKELRDKLSTQIAKVMKLEGDYARVFNLFTDAEIKTKQAEADLTSLREQYAEALEGHSEREAIKTLLSDRDEPGTYAKVEALHDEHARLKAERDKTL